MIYNKNIIQGNLHFRHNIAIRKNFQTKTAESLHITVALFIPTGFSVLELISWVIDSIIHLQYSTCFIPKWFWFCNKSLEWIYHLFRYCMIQYFWTNSLSELFSDSFLLLVPLCIDNAFEQITWVKCSVTYLYHLFFPKWFCVLNTSHEWIGLFEMSKLCTELITGDHHEMHAG